MKKGATDRKGAGATKNIGNKKNKTEKSILHHKNEEVRLEITDIGSGGEGIGKTEDGYTLFVKDAVIGDLIRAKITKTNKGYGFARLVQVLRASSERTDPRCPVSRQCGGCQIQSMVYESQLKFKQEKVRSDLIRIGKFDADFIDTVMQPIVGMKDPWRYRNKAQVPIGEKDGHPVAGFYAGRTHSIIPMTDCLLGDAVNKDILAIILKYMVNCNVSPYNEETGRGLLRHVLIRNGIYSGQRMVCLVVNGDRLPYEEDLVDALQQIEGISSITLNTNTVRSNVILGQKLRTLWGEDEIEDILHIYEIAENKIRAEKESESEAEVVPETEFVPTDESVSFRISPLSFYQVNPRQTEKLYSIALHYAGLTGKETVWDLYCGVGTISLFMARRAGSVHGVEIIPQAIENAKENARRNGIANAEFTVGKAEEVLPAFVEEQKAAGKRAQVDVICVDPPRKGCDEKCLQTILEIGPDRVVYVSCDPATLARDLRILVDGGYALEKVTPVDQFGHTVHVETACLLSKKCLV